MKAKELIETLSKLDPETEIYTFDSGGYAEIVSITRLSQYAIKNPRDRDHGKWVIWDF